uniref:Fatty acid binding protein b n=2 Tax=Mesocestoides vogae TaxID=160009 RepID=A4UTU1_9CEST|nr:fatty acid binding protein b [Mesocestoides vogae]
MDAFLGSWKLSKSEGFDEVMRHLGVNFIARKAGNTLKPTVTITSVGDGRYHMKLESTFKNTEFTFKLGEECDEVTADGRKVKSTITMDGSTMKHVQVGEKTTHIERVIEGDKMLTTVTVDDLVSKREYTRC